MVKWQLEVVGSCPDADGMPGREEVWGNRRDEARLIRRKKNHMPVTRASWCVYCAMAKETLWTSHTTSLVTDSGLETFIYILFLLLYRYF